VSVAETAGPGLRSPDQLAWARSVARETDNLRTALDWAVETPSADHALRLIAPLEVNGIAIGYSAAAWAETVLQVPGASDHRLFSNVASWASWSALARGDVALAERYAGLIGEGSATIASRTRATLAYFEGDLDTARAAGEEWVVRARGTGNGNELSQALIALAMAQASTGNAASARDTAEEGLEVARGTGVPSTLANALISIPWSLLDEDAERALHLFEEGFELGIEMGDALNVALAGTGKGVYYASQGNWHLALDQVRDAIERIKQFGTATGLIGGTLGVAAVTLTALGQFEPGAIVLGASYHLAPGAYERPEQLRVDAAATLIDELGQARYGALFAEGAGMSADEALAALSSTLESLQ
jgi:tetratricopeptide (TPR) repeat protein